MDAQKVAAHFVAFTFFLNRQRREPVLLDEAGRFARQNWQAFLPCASEDLGKFLTGGPEEFSTPAKLKLPRRRARRASRRQLAGAI